MIRTALGVLVGILLAILVIAVFILWLAVGPDPEVDRMLQYHQYQQWNADPEQW